ncbi:MAG: hypothetical protein HYW88_03150 [Candidatus Sungbacteria bacterium]|nr:hypothetical protein [Candidatus Sungbacteria bacterium]
MWDGATKIGSGIFAGTNRYATTTLTGNFIIPKDGDKILTVKGDLAAIGTSLSGTEGALVMVDFDGHDSTGTQGTGQSSGTTISHGSADTAVSGVRVFKSYPTVAKVSVPTNTLSNGTIALYRFKVTADSHGDVGLYKFTFRIATTTATATVRQVYGYSDSSFSTPAYANAGLLTSQSSDFPTSGTDFDVTFDPVGQAGTAEVIQVPAGTTRYFELRGTIAGAISGSSVSTQLQGDAAYPTLPKYNGSATSSNLMAVAGATVGIDADTNDNFIWTPNATTTQPVGGLDFTNGYGVLGLPSTNLSAEVVSK